MAILNGIVTVLLVVTALILIVTVLLQPGESNGLGAIAGGAETFFGKSKAQTMNKKLSVLTTVVAIVFALLVCAVYVMQPNSKSADDYGSFWEMLFDNGEAEELGSTEVEHDHDGDGKADHTAEEHKDEAKDDKAEDTTAADTTAASK